MPNPKRLPLKTCSRCGVQSRTVERVKRANNALLCAECIIDGILDVWEADIDAD